MTNYYEPDKLKANAYMIKEMGDGFLCSVGFPFTCKGRIVDETMALAEQFVEIFAEEVHKYFPKEEVFCGIGISLGTIAGYYPKSGIKQYDLYGDAIVHATRYEAMRKQLFGAGVAKGNIIILQEQVYTNLSSELKSKLIKYNLKDMSVRDDPKAKNLYYKVVGSKSESLSRAS